MARADAAVGGEIADANTPLRSFDVTQGARDDGMHFCVGQAFEEKPLEAVDALVRRAREAVFVSERVKCGAAEPDPSVHHRVGGNPTDQECHAWTKPHT